MPIEHGTQMMVKLKDGNIEWKFLGKENGNVLLTDPDSRTVLFIKERELNPVSLKQIENLENPGKLKIGTQLKLKNGKMFWEYCGTEGDKVLLSDPISGTNLRVRRADVDWQGIPESP